MFIIFHKYYFIFIKKLAVYTYFIDGYTCLTFHTNVNYAKKDRWQVSALTATIKTKSNWRSDTMFLT